MEFIMIRAIQIVLLMAIQLVGLVYYKKKSQIHIKFINQDYWILRISHSILNQFPWNFKHTIFHLCRNYPENFAKFW